MNEDVKDDRVSHAYRETAEEMAPDALNQAILKQARREAGRRYARQVLWQRPLAWAATVGLCLAIVVELSNVPQPDSNYHSVPAGDAGEQRLMDSSRSIAPAEPGEPGRQQDSPAAPAARLAPAADAEEPVRTEATDALAKSQAADDLSFAIDSTPAIEEARELARMREGDNVSEQSGHTAEVLAEELAQPVLQDFPADSGADSGAGPEEGSASGIAGERKRSEVQAFASAAAPALEAVVDAPCDARARAKPESWLACIEGLETDGHDEIAREQRERLQATFPDFDVP